MAQRAQYRPRRADRRGAADARADLHRSRLRARPADQRRRARRQVRPRRAAADHRRSGRGARASPPSSTGSTRNAARSRPRCSEAAEALADGAGQPRGRWSSPAHGWHPGVIGIVAGRLKEKIGRPAIVIALDEDGIGKGSGRSIAGVDLGAAVLAAKDSGPARRRRRPRDGGGADDRRRPDRRARRFPRRAARRRRRAQPRRPRAAARCRAGAAAASRRRWCDALEAGGPYGAGWPAPRVAAGPVRIVKADVVGNGHVRADRRRRRRRAASRRSPSARPKARSGQALLAAPPHRRLWLAGRLKLDDYMAATPPSSTRGRRLGGLGSGL